MDETTKAVLELVSVCKGVFERLDHLIGVLENGASTLPPLRVVEPPSMAKVPPKPANTNSPQRAIKTLDPYHTQKAAQIVKILLHPEVRAVGKMTKSISEEVGLSRTSTERMMRALLQALPFIGTSEGRAHSYFRIRSDMLEEAQNWLEQVGDATEGRKDLGHYSCSDLAYKMYAPKLVKVLLEGPEEGLTTDALYKDIGIKPTMFRGVANKVLLAGFISLPIVPRGKPNILKLTDRKRAEEWLHNSFPGEAERVSSPPMLS